MKNSLITKANSTHSYLYPFLLGVSALSISLSSAYYSVYGLGALFAGASIQIMVMAGTLEFAKVLLSGFLHRFWKDLPSLLKSYLTVAVLILVIISSVGIYGYLASAYKNSSILLDNTNSRVEVLEQRKIRYLQELEIINKERETLGSNILNLTQGLSNNTVQYVDPTTSQVITTQSSASRNIIQQQLTQTRQRESQLASQIDVLSDSLVAIDQRILEVSIESTAAKDLGPLMFISEVTGFNMDKVVNILIIFIMIVFDPLAITMIIATSASFDKVRSSKHEVIPFTNKQPVPYREILQKTVEEKQEEAPQVKTPSEPAVKEEVKVKDVKAQKEENIQPNIYGEVIKPTLTIKAVKLVSNFYHITYSNGSVERIHKDHYKDFYEKNRHLYRLS